MRRIVVVGWITGLVLAATACSWAGLFSVSDKEQRDVGQQAAREIEKKVKIVGEGVKAPRIHGKPIDAIVRDVGFDMVRAAGDKGKKWNFSFKIIQNKQVNAFALPGGPIYIYSGMLDALKVNARNYNNGINMLAAVLGHEATHVLDEHWAEQYEKDMEMGIGLALILGATGASKSARQVAGVLQFAQSQKYSRKDEYGADDGGIELLDKSGKYDPRGMVDMLKMLDKVAGDTPNSMVWLSSHPQTEDRITRAEKNVAALDH